MDARPARRSRRLRSALLGAAALAAVTVLAPAVSGQTRRATPARPAAPPAAATKKEAPAFTCAQPLGEGLATKRAFCDIVIGRSAADGQTIALPAHTGPVVLTFDLHNRHTYSEELVRLNKAYQRYTATVGVMTADNTLLARAIVQTEFRTTTDLVDRVAGGAGVTAPKAVAPTGTESIRVSIPAEEQSVSIVGEKLSVLRPEGIAAATDLFTAPGRPVAIISNVMIEYRPAPARLYAGGAHPRPPPVNLRPAQGPPAPSRRSSLSDVVSIVVPVYNEVRTVRAVIDRLLAIDLPVAREIIVVDDGSTDGTREVLARVGGDGLPVTIVLAERNGGKGSAIRAGFARATGTIVAIQDADLELDPQQLSALLAPIVAGEADVVYGSRFLAGNSGAPFITLVANRVLTGVTNLLYGGRLTDMETCYKIMRTDVARSLGLRANRFDIEPEITARLLRQGHRIHELPVRFDPRSRAQGKKIGWRDGVRALQVLAAERFR